jgi:hypothetical protein
MRQWSQSKRSTRPSRLGSARRISRPLHAAALLLLCGCSDASSADDAAELGPDTHESAAHEEATELEKPLHRYTIALGEGHAVTYRAYSDGALIIGEQGRARVDEAVIKSADASAVGPVALFRATHPGVPVPRALQDLQSFMDRSALASGPDDASESVGSGRSSASDGAPRPSMAKDTTADPASFLNIFGCFFGDDDVFAACVPNWAGNAFAAATSRWAIYKLAPFRQGLRFDTSIAGTPRLSLSLNQGAFWVQLQSGPIKRHGGKSYPDVVNHRLDIFSGGEHHFSARFHNYQWDDPNCAEVWSHDSSAGLGQGKTSTRVPLCTSHYGKL